MCPLPSRTFAFSPTSPSGPLSLSSSRWWSGSHLLVSLHPNNDFRTQTLVGRLHPGIGLYPRVLSISTSTITTDCTFQPHATTTPWGTKDERAVVRWRVNIGGNRFGSVYGHLWSWTLYIGSLWFVSSCPLLDVFLDPVFPGLNPLKRRSLKCHKGISETVFQVNERYLLFWYVRTTPRTNRHPSGKWTAWLGRDRSVIRVRGWTERWSSMYGWERVTTRNCVRWEIWS